MARVKSKPRRNRRLDPEIRKELILDETARLISSEGVTSVSMERVAREAGVSKALVYVYFPNQTTLLQELLLREQKRLVNRQAKEVQKAVDFEDLIRRTTSTYLAHVEERGDLVQRLMSEPSVAVAMGELDRRDRQRGIEFLAKEIVDSYSIPRRTALLAAELSMGMTGTAGEMISQGRVDRKTVEDLNIVLALGIVDTLKANYKTTSASPKASQPRRKRSKPPREKSTA